MKLTVKKAGRRRLAQCLKLHVGRDTALLGTGFYNWVPLLTEQTGFYN